MPALQGVRLQAWDALAAILLMPLIVAGFANARVDGWQGRACTTLGTLSYGIYILHVPLATGLSALFLKLGAPMPPGIVWYLMIATMAATAAAVAQNAYDRPMRKLLS
jgi:peptidoglycan/LPS O-acetylase OafA/YrhL